ncbi:putative mannitol dehydrogenase [Rozella allomycis CSF55]|uniref:Putative mannitol dehydrogenase n=1 Tax=Rozella allomycis (strain CSF55) TaxID=988480 RepID=A0A4P9YC18_ROZAC|nr:putative mannitol dehydrogenase [Rozella allomycis CSF55]
MSSPYNIIIAISVAQASMTQAEIEAYACHSKGSPIQKWTYKAHPLGPHDIEIEISHCGICHSDIHTLDSGWGPTMYPVVVGHEIIGKITAKGPEVSHLNVGDRVGVGAMVSSCLKSDCPDCTNNNDPCCSGCVFTYNSKYPDGHIAYGGYAKKTRVDSNYAFKIPENIASEYAAPLLCAGVTTYTPLRRYGCGPGKTVGVVGIGGLGHLGLQFAKAMGADRVYAFSTSPNKEKEAKTLGATDFVNLNQPVSQLSSVMKSIDLLLVSTCAPQAPWDLYLSFLKTNGKLLLVGLPESKISFVPGVLVMKNLSIIGSLIGSRNDIREMLKLCDEKNIRPMIDVLPMDKVNEGIARVRKNDVRYRIVLQN